MQNSINIYSEDIKSAFKSQLLPNNPIPTISRSSSASHPQISESQHWPGMCVIKKLISIFCANLRIGVQRAACLGFSEKSLFFYVLVAKKKTQHVYILTVQCVHSKLRFFLHPITLCPLQKSILFIMSGIPFTDKIPDCLLICEKMLQITHFCGVNKTFNLKIWLCKILTDSINIRWNQYNRKRKGVLLSIIFPILPVLFLLGEVEYTEMNE